MIPTAAWRLLAGRSVYEKVFRDEFNSWWGLLLRLKPNSKLTPLGGSIIDSTVLEAAWRNFLKLILSGNCYHRL
jgi:hypothetical protein